MKRREETPILGIFQDPLLMLIAVILMGTLWIVVPGEPTTPRKDAANLDMQQEIDKMKADMVTFDKKIKELREEIARIAEEITILETREQESKKEEAEKKSEIDRLGREIAVLKALLQAKKEKLKELEKELQKASKRSEEAKQLEGIRQKIGELKKEIAEKEALLKKLEEKLKNLEEERIEKTEKRKAEEEVILKLQHQLELEREEIGKLEAEKEEMNRMLAERGGLGESTADAVKGKQAVLFEVVNNTLVCIDEKNYKIEAYRIMYKGRIETEAKLTRKSSAKSESIDSINKASSAFMKELNKLKPETHFILFVVQNDSFEIFLAARQIAWQKGFAVSWQPWEGPIYVGPGGAQAEGR